MRVWFFGSAFLVACALLAAGWWLYDWAINASIRREQRRERERVGG